MRLAFRRTSSARALITLFDDAGEQIHGVNADPNSASQQSTLLKLLNPPGRKPIISHRDLLRAIAGLDAEVSAEHEVEFPPDPESDPVVMQAVRLKLVPKLKIPRAGATGEVVGVDALDALRQAVSGTHGWAEGDEVEVQSPDPAKLCNLDGDYHNVPAKHLPTDDQIRGWILQLAITPIAYWRSHGGGVKLWFAASGGYRADDLAAIAAVEWLALSQWATVEIKSNAFHPLFPRVRTGQRCGKPDIRSDLPTQDVTHIRDGFEAGFNADDRDRWLEENGRHLMETAPHETCPIEPGRPSTHPAAVFFGERGVYCHSCNAAGVGYPGVRRAGWVPWAKLIGSTGESELYRLARNAVNWTHARLMLRYCYRQWNESLRQPLYRACLKLAHGPDDPRVDGVFRAPSVARIEGEWTWIGDRHGTRVRPQAVNTFRALPGAWMVGEPNELGECKITPDPQKVEEFGHAGRDLSAYGYDDLTTMKGLPVWGCHLRYPAHMIPIPDEFLHLDAELRPVYRRAADAQTPGDRMPVDRAVRLIESVLPGLDWEYVRFLIACRGLSEGGGQIPKLLVHGSSGAGKSTAVRFAAACVGDRVGPITYSGSAERNHQAVKAALDRGRFVVVDEIFKHASTNRMTPREAMDFILNLGSDQTGHELYRGPVKLGVNFTLVMTDTHIPHEIRRDVQLARRLVSVRLRGGRVEWEDSLVRHNLADVGDFRALGVEYARACDAVVSAVIDTHYATRPPSLADLVAAYGYSMLEHDAEREPGQVSDHDRELVDLFLAVCRAPELTGTEQSRRPGVGWKRIAKGDTTEIREAWDAVADGTTGDDWYTSRRVAGEDWRRLLTRAGWTVPAGDEIQLDQGTNRSVLYVRFRMGGKKTPDRVNHAVIVEGVPGVNGVPGLAVA